MIFTPEYSMKLSIGDSLFIAIVGLLVVIAILAIISLSIMVISKLIQSAEKRAKTVGVVPDNSEKVKIPAGLPLPETQSQGELTLIKTDEATAAVIMAIVSDSSAIPLNRLCFKSIKLLEGDEG